MDPLAVYGDLRLESVCRGIDSFLPCCRVLARLPVPKILGRRSLTQVAEPIVGLVHVDVIDASAWHLSVDVQPCQTVSLIAYPVKFDLDVT